jgi:Prp8 binding protein
VSSSRCIATQANIQGGADGLLVATDLTTGERIARYSAHYGPLNSLAVTISGGKELVLTGGDDGIARVWDLSMVGKEPVVEFDDGRDCPVTAVEWSGDGNQCFVGGIDNEVKVSTVFLDAVTELRLGMGPENE